MNDPAFIYQRLSVGQFRDAFVRMDRHHNYTYAGLGFLFEYLEDRAAGTGQPFELDVIECCMLFDEYATLAEVAEAHYVQREEEWDDARFLAEVRDAIEDDGFLHQFEGGWMVERY